MLHLTGRTDLIATIKQGVKSRACLRAFGNGTVEVLGGFDPILPGTDRPGWAIRVTSVNGSEWFYILVPDMPGYEVLYVGRVYWENWIGNPEAPQRSLLSGDDPEKYGRRRDEANAAIASGRDSGLDFPE